MDNTRANLISGGILLFIFVIVLSPVMSSTNSAAAANVLPSGNWDVTIGKYGQDAYKGILVISLGKFFHGEACVTGTLKGLPIHGIYSQSLWKITFTVNGPTYTGYLIQEPMCSPQLCKYTLAGYFDITANGHTMENYLISKNIRYKFLYLT